jgi:hypothetical protein
METKKQTAVEWLLEEITYDDGFGQRWSSFRETVDLNPYFEKAKEMEKAQIIEACNYGCSDWGSWKDSEQYYNETYGK